MIITEKTWIVEGLAEGLSVGEVALEFGQGTRTLKACIEKPVTKARQDKGMRSVSQYDSRKAGRQVTKDLDSIGV